MILFVGAALAALLVPGGVSAQGPCDGAGPGCRAMTAAEETAYWARLKALDAALPVPDPARFETAGLEELLAAAAGIDAKVKRAADLRAMGVPMTCLAWPAGCFPTDERGVGRSYRLKQGRGGAGRKADDPLAIGTWALGEVAVDATLSPYPYLLPEEDGKCPDAPRGVSGVEKLPAFLAFETADGESVTLTVVFGKRTCNYAETVNVEKPAKILAPVVSIELAVSAPKSELAALKKKIDRRAFEALLGPVVR